MEGLTVGILKVYGGFQREGDDGCCERGTVVVRFLDGISTSYRSV